MGDEIFLLCESILYGELTAERDHFSSLYPASIYRMGQLENWLAGHRIESDRNSLSGMCIDGRLI